MNLDKLWAEPCLEKEDKEIFTQIDHELKRQQNNIELIASENIVSKAVLQATGSILTNKYAEGFPSKRYYNGCEYVDNIENIAINRAKELFNCNFANVQPHSGSQANMAVYLALLNPGDTILGMDLNSGGHLTHGSKVSFSGKLYNAVAYGLNKETEEIDYEQVQALATEHQPKIIIAGGSAYSRIINFKEFRNIADSVGAYLWVDMAHFAGLVAAGVHPNPLEYADVATSTTHKTLRGPRGGLILTNREDLIKKFNAAIFPGSQGGPLEHVIAAKAVAFKEALTPEFKEYSKQVVKNAKIMAKHFQDSGYRVVSKGTDTHLFLVEVSKFDLNGAQAADILDSVHITCNKNSLPFDTLPPSKTSGIRIGTPAITTRGFKEEDCIKTAEIIINVLKNTNKENLTIKEEVKKETINSVKSLCSKYPIY